MVWLKTSNTPASSRGNSRQNPVWEHFTDFLVPRAGQIRRKSWEKPKQLCWPHCRAGFVAPLRDYLHRFSRRSRRFAARVGQRFSPTRAVPAAPSATTRWRSASTLRPSLSPGHDRPCWVVGGGSPASDDRAAVSRSAGIWQRLFETVAAPCEPPRLAALDSSHAKAHRCVSRKKGAEI